MAENDGFLTNQPRVSSGRSVPLPPSRADAFKNDGTADPNQSGDETVVDNNSSALKQKGYLHEKGFMGDRSLENATAAFYTAVNIGKTLSPLGRSISRTSYKSTEVRNKTTRYFLYDNEKALLQKKAGEFSANGIIPYDVMEEFLYILVCVDNYDDLKYISQVVGIPELDNINLVREPIPLLSVKDLYKVGYLANGVASIVKQYDVKFNIVESGNYNKSPFFPMLAGVAITQFPVVSIAASLVSDIAKQLGISTAITAAFSAFGSLPSIGKLAAIAGLPNLLSQFGSLSSLVSTTIESIKSFGISALKSVANSLFSLIRMVRNVTNIISQISGVDIIAATTAKIGDITTQMVKIATMGISMTNLVSGIMSAFNSLTGPLRSGAAVQNILGRVGGYALNGVLSELTTGQRLPTSVISRNPMMISPSYSGKAFFGEMLAPQAAVDQMFCKVISAFPEDVNGAGNVAFGMQNFGSYGGALSVPNLISKIVYGVSTAPTTGSIGSIIASTSAMVLSSLGVPAGTLIESRRSDNALPFLMSAATSIIKQSNSPFPFSTFYNGWKLASSVGNDVQRYQPQYLTVVRTSL